ncbi:MAG: SdiA-regulated domain-containing protein [Ignavibacteria bacterium]
MKKIIIIMLSIILFALVSCKDNTVESGGLEPIVGYQLLVTSPAAIAYNADKNTLYAVSEQNGYLYELTLSGFLLNSVNLNATRPKGISFLSRDTLIIAEEGTGKLVKYTTSGTRLNAFSVNVSTQNGYGLNGVSYSKSQDEYFAVTRQHPSLLLQFSNSGTEIKRLEVNFSSDLTDIYYDSLEEVSWVVSSSSHLLFKIDDNGNVIKSWGLPVSYPEGITFDNQNKMYIISNYDAKLYVFQKPY